MELFRRSVKLANWYADRRPQSDTAPYVDMQVVLQVRREVVIPNLNIQYGGPLATRIADESAHGTLP